MPKIICTVTNDLNFDQRMIRICSTLQEGGYDVLLLGRKKQSSLPLDKQIFQQRRLYCYFEKGKLFYIEFNIRLIFFLLFYKTDAICSIDLDTILPGFLVSKLKRTICIYDAHEYFTEVPELVDRNFTKKVWESIANLIVPRIKYCYSVGPILAAVLSKRYGSTFSTIRNVPFKRNYTTDYPKPFDFSYIFYQGALNMGRGLKEAILAMHSISDLRLVLAGEGDLSEELRELVKNEKLENKVQFLGFVKPVDLPQYTQHAHIGLNLLENKGLSYYYSLSNKTFDYIQAGIPSIQMKFPEYELLNKDHPVSVLLDDLSPETINQTIQKLISDKTLYDDLKSNCSFHASKLNWETEGKSLLKIYKNIFR